LDRTRWQRRFEEGQSKLPNAKTLVAASYPKATPTIGGFALGRLVAVPIKNSYNTGDFI
jgi:hypothetical protein